MTDVLPLVAFCGIPALQVFLSFEMIKTFGQPNKKIKDFDLKDNLKTSCMSGMRRLFKMAFWKPEYFVKRCAPKAWKKKKTNKNNSALLNNESFSINYCNIDLIFRERKF